MVAEKAADLILGNENVVLSVPTPQNVVLPIKGSDDGPKTPANTPDLALP